ncbi:MAG: hypothetical protein ACJAWL_001444 [Motiliproteus sp.]|jgi:hypothetical protein
MGGNRERKPLRRRGCALSLMALWLSLLLSGCSSYQLAYNNADWLLFRWVDDYVELTSAQHAELQPLVERWHAEHRRTELPGYAAFLVAMRHELRAPPLETARFAQWQTQVEAHWLALRSSLVPLAITLLEQLERSQQQELLAALRTEIDARRQATLERSAPEQTEYRIDLYRERMKRWIGRLDSVQRSALQQLVQASPKTESQWLTYRSLWVDELERALLIRLDRKAFHARIQALILSPGSLGTEAQQRLLVSSRQPRSDYMLTLINGLSVSQRDQLLGELDGLIDAAETLQSD